MRPRAAARDACARRAGPARIRPLFGARRRRRCRRISNARSATRSTSARRRRRSMRPTPPTTARCRSASSTRARGRRWSKPSASAANMTRRSSRAAAAPALPARAATSPSASISRAIFTTHRGRSASRTARVEPGCILDRLQDAARPHGLMFGPDPATHDHNTLGGMIGNDSCGVHSVKWGRTLDNVERLMSLTYDGLQLELGPTPEQARAPARRTRPARRHLPGARRAARSLRQPDRGALSQNPAARIRLRRSRKRCSPARDFNVAQAVTGTEGTCVIVLDAVVKLVPRPELRAHRAAVVRRRLCRRRCSAGAAGTAARRDRGLR